VTGDRVTPMPWRSGDLTRARRERTEDACRWLGAVLAEYVTGDLGHDDIAESIGQAAAAQLRRHGDPEEENAAATVRALRHLADALERMADDATTAPSLLAPGSAR